MTDAVEKIAAAVLYEGYVLWPYRRSAPKNHKRWTLGGVYSRAFSERGGGHDPWLMQTQCLLQRLGAAPEVRVTVRFLHVVERRITRVGADGARELVDALRVGGTQYLAWEEAAERTIEVGPLALPELAAGAPLRTAVSIPAGCEEEPLTYPDGAPAGALVRTWEALEGYVEVEAKRMDEALFRLTVRVANTAGCAGPAREDALRRTFVSTHTILRATGGAFVSLMDPPEALKPQVEACDNRHTWPVLAGEEGATDTLLSSPIILYDYPRIAPESPGDLFDGTEIDQLLTLNVLALTDAEKEEMRASDPRAREILERAEALTTADFLRMNGAIREFREIHDFRVVDEEPVWPGLSGIEGVSTFGVLDAPAPDRADVGGVEVRAGSRVRLRPKAGGDIFDIALTGREAIVEAIEQDVEGNLHLAVTVADDPGRDLGAARLPGHRFFFALDEVEPLHAERAGGSPS